MALVAGSSIAVTDGSDRRLALLDSSGRRKDVPIPSFRGELRITAEIVDAAIAARARGRGAGSARDPFGQMPSPKALPAFGWLGEPSIGLLKVTTNGSIWVTDVSGIDDHVPYPEWVVVGQRGALLARIATTTVLDVLDVSGDMVLALKWDNDDVERIELRKIQWQTNRGAGAIKAPVP
jgi:hypothetical protein